jgi:hypothetical protein
MVFLELIRIHILKSRLYGTDFAHQFSWLFLGNDLAHRFSVFPSISSFCHVFHFHVLWNLGIINYGKGLHDFRSKLITQPTLMLNKTVEAHAFFQLFDEFRRTFPQLSRALQISHTAQDIRLMEFVFFFWI